MARRRPLVDRFWEKVDRSGGPTACWPWLGAKCRPGRNTASRGVYGHIRAGGARSKMLKAHRVALIFKTGRERKHREAGHSLLCTTTLCCNPDHLRWCTRAQNHADWMLKHSTRDLVAIGVRAAQEVIL